MKILDRTFDTAAQNLACDEALLDLCEDGYEDEILRFWEPRLPFVVLGYSNKIGTEVAINSCKARGIPVLRRPSGGGTVVQAPGCLNFSLILPIPARGPLAQLTGTNQLILETHCKALAPLLPGRSLHVQGTSDLTLDDLKISGNAQRRKKKNLLFHGTFLLDMDLSLIEACLQMPSLQPDYRQNRPHHAFVTNTGLTAGQVKDALVSAWRAHGAFEALPLAAIDTLVQEKYTQPEWNEKF